MFEKMTIGIILLIVIIFFAAQIWIWYDVFSEDAEQRAFNKHIKILLKKENSYVSL